MNTLSHLLKWISLVAAGVMTVLVLVILFIGFTPLGARIAADQISSLVSTPDQSIEISAPRGLLTGQLRLDTVTIADRDGAFAHINDIAVDWSPLRLLNGTFHADLISVAKIELDRTPLPAAAPKEETSGSFSLPVEISVDRLSVPDIHIGEKVAGRSFDLNAEGNLKAATDNIAATLGVGRKDVAGAGISADIAFVPNQNILKLKASLTEPQGGLLATLLTLPGAPAVELNLDGEGALSDWEGTLNGQVDGNPILNVTGRHMLAADGTRRLELKGGGQPDMLLPPVYRQLFAGETKLDFVTTLDPQGRINIQNGNLETGALLLTASGTIDTNGQNDLAANLIGTAGPVDFRWPLDGGELRALVNGADLTVRGNAQAARLTAAASLRSLELPQGKLDEVKLSATSDDLNLQNRSATVQTSLSVAQSNLVSADLNRIVRAPLTITAPLSVTATGIGFEAATLESASIGGTGSGTYELDTKTLAANLRLFALPAILPEALATKFDTTIAVNADINAVIGGRINLENLVVKSGTVEANGRLALDNGTIEAQLGGRFPAIEKLAPQASGAAGFSLDATGPLSAPDFKLNLNSARATTAGRALENLTITATGKADPAAPQADLVASGTLDGQAIDASASLVQVENGTEIPALRVTVGRNVLNGDIRFTPQFLPSGNLSFNFPDLSLIAALAAQQAQGDLTGSVVLDSTNGTTSATIKANSGTLRQGTVEISKLAADLSITDLKALAANGTITADRVGAGAATVSALKLGINHTGATTAFDLGARYDNAPLITKGSINTGASPLVVKLDQFSATPRGINVRLAQPSSVAVNGGTARISDLTIQTGEGRIVVNGTAGATLDINAAIRALPATLANAFSPGLDAAGTISGTVTAKGSAADPVVNYDLAWANAAVSQTRAAGLSTLDIKAKGRFASGTLNIETNVSGQSGLSLSGGGSLGISGNRPLSMAFKGQLPFAALAAQTAAQGLSVDGSASIDVKISGSASAPVITGSVSTRGTRLTDVRRNLTVNDLGATITFDQNRAVISNLSGRLAGGGTLSASGSVSIAPGSGFPADLTITLNKAGYNDGTLVTTVVSGGLTLKGPLLTAPVLGGKLALEKSAITIPERLPASLTEIDIKHRNAPPQVRAQMRELRADGGDGGSGSSSSPMALDLAISAPGGIFVRGRGIDAELTGNITVRGTVADPVIAGGFTMRRGRMEILTRRLDFTEGNITFGGGLIPVLDMEASSAIGSGNVTVTVSGSANDPAFAFSSSPALPQDEVMAQLIFGQSMSKLSALQIARLADAASQLAGGRSTSLFDSLRSNLGVDDLDISTDAEGRATVSAGRYINDRTYLELEQGGESGAKAIINLDVGRGVKLRGEAGANGSGAAGIFYEKEY